MVCLLLGSSNKVISDLFKVNWGLVLSRSFICAVMEDLIGEVRLGAMRVDLSVCIRWLMEIPESLAVDREVFMVLI